MSTPSAPKPPSPSPAALAPYARVKQHLKERLTAGEWPPGAQLPYMLFNFRRITDLAGKVTETIGS